MKQLALAGLLVFGLVGCATTSATKGVEAFTTYQKVVEIPNTKQDAIYEGSRQWVAKNFKSANSVIQYQDKATGTIIGKGNMPYVCTGVDCVVSFPPSLEFTFQVDAKDNKARVSFSDLNVHYPAGYSAMFGAVAETNKKIYKDEDIAKAKATLDSTINSLASDVAKTNGVDKNW